MARTSLNIPAVFSFATELTVRIGDINYGGHLGNGALLTLLQEARLQFLAQKNCSERDVGGGVALIMTEAVVLYKGQAFHGDVLKVAVAMDDVGKCGFDLYYRVTESKTGRLIAEAKTGMACFDYQQNRLARMPESFASAFAGVGHGG